MVKATASSAVDPRFESRLSLASDIQTGSPAAALPEDWRVWARLGLVGPMSVDCDREIESLMCSFSQCRSR